MIRVMRPAGRRLAWLCAVALAVAAIGPSHARGPGSEPGAEQRERFQADMLRLLPSGLAARFDGSPGAPAASERDWRQIYHELRAAPPDPPRLPALPAVLKRAQSSLRRSIIPLAVLDYAYERVTPELWEEAARTGTRPGDLDNALEAERVVAATALRAHTYRGHRVDFRLAAEDFFTNLHPDLPDVAADFADGRGWVTLDWGRIHTVRYGEAGLKTVRLRIASERGGVPLAAAFVFDVRRLDAPTPDDTLHVQATIPYLGALAGGEAYVYLSDLHTALTNPVVILEGFDIDNSMGWDELYALLNREELLETLRTRGYDLVVLDFADGVDYIQRNAFLTVELVEQIRSLIAPEREFVLVGASMGGLVGRYALAYMEQQGLAHSVRTFISFDAPQQGANIPLGIQYWVAFFAQVSEEAAALLAGLDSPAARQMLVYHHTDPPGGTGQSDPLRQVLLDELAALDSYPSMPRRVAVANGSGAQQDQGFAPTEQIIRWEYESFLVDITGNVWAVPNEVSGRIFEGLIDFVLLPAEEQSVTVSLTRPFDNAPGGWRGSMAQMDSVEAPYGDIVALHDNHAFIPTVSALALDTDDLFYDIVGDPNLLDRTPFDAVYFPLENQEHVAITPENAAWFLDEIDPQTSGIAGGGVVAASRRSLSLRATPNPVRASARLTYRVPADGWARVEVHDVSGRLIAVVADGLHRRGVHETLWNATGRGVGSVGAGVYFVRVHSAGAQAARTLIVR